MLDAIRARSVNGVGPSYEELAGDMGISSKGEVHRVLKGLRERGMVSWMPGRARSLHLTAPTKTDDLRIRSFSDSSLLAEVERRGLR